MNTHQISPKSVSLATAITTQKLQNILKSVKAIKTVNISREMIAVYYAILGTERFGHFLKNIYLKENGTHFIAHQNYVTSLIEALKRLGILDIKKFSSIRSIEHLLQLRTRLLDIYAVRYFDKDAHHIIGVFDHYVKFVAWANGSDTPVHPISPIPAPKITPAYAQAA